MAAKKETKFLADEDNAKPTVNNESALSNVQPVKINK